MAIIIPAQIDDKAMPGEKKIFNLLREALDDKYIVYFNPIISGSIPVNPDFIILGDDLGVVVLEVKDYTTDTIREINQYKFVIGTNGQKISIKNPYVQVKRYAETLKDILDKNPQLINHEGPYEGQLKFPYSYAVVFPYLSKTDSEKIRLNSVIPNQCLFLKEDMRYASGDFSERDFLKKLRNTRRASFDFELSHEDIDTIRGVLFPEIRVEGFLSYASSDEAIKTLDKEQEKYAKSLREGHQLVRGVAGSGKTIILITRAIYLKKIHPDWRVLVVAFNRSLTKWIQNSIEERMPFSDIEVLGFHQLCIRLLKSTGQWEELSDSESDKDDFWDTIVPEKVLKEIENGRISMPRYEAILIDEAQDFEVLWFKVLLKLLNTETNELMIVLDQAQKIYRGGFTWKSVGIQIVGRSKRLEITYRTTKEIAQFAYDFIKNDDTLLKELQAENESYINPNKTIRQGPHPKIVKNNTFDEECEKILSLIYKLKEIGLKESDVFILSRSRNTCQEINSYLTNHGISSEFITNFSNWNQKNESIKCLTMHSSKGLESKVVIICNACNTPDKNISMERRLLYVAMRRAQKILILSYNGKESQFVKELKEQELRVLGSSKT